MRGMTLNTRLAALALATLSIGPAWAADPLAPYPVSVWSRVLFGPDGKPQSLDVVEADQYPAGFVQNVKQRVAQASIQPPLVDGKPVTLRSGVEMRFVITPKPEGGAAVRVDGLSITALPVKRSLPAYPADIAATGGWEGEITGVCTVGTNGRCRKVDLVVNAGMPESVRRYAKVAFDGWEFEPQEVDGKPVESEYRLVMRLNTLDAAPEDFRQDKFLRVTKGR
jgi:outer membrane biosynthesis protein TonB